MKPIFLLLAVAVMAAGCNGPTQPGREEGVVSLTDNGDRHVAVVHVAAPTGNPAIDVPNIQAAVDAATPGATIEFARGTYGITAETQFVVSVPGGPCREIAGGPRSGESFPSPRVLWRVTSC